MIAHLKPLSGAHIGAQVTVSHIMWQVMLALTPATVFGLLIFGWPAVNLFAVTVLSALGFEAFCVQLAGRKANRY